MSSRPDTVEVGPYTYELSWDKNLSQAGASGLTNADNLLIAVDPTLAKETQQSTLVHEVLHAAWKQTALKITYPDIDSDSVGEQIIQTLEPLVYQFIKQNPEVIRWLRS